MSELAAHHVGITVSDLEGALAFYRDVLGLSVLDRFSVSGDAFAEGVGVEGAAADFVHLEGGGARVELVTYEPEAAVLEEPAVNRPGAVHLGLSVDDLDAFYADLPEDVETLSAPRTTESGASICFLRDPEGNLIEVLEP